jgi:hypothetical protein
MLINDHSPRRLHNHTFHVVTRGERLITVNDLAFTDDDSGADAGALLYSFAASADAHAAIFRSALPTVAVHNFTQRDIVDNVLLLRHVGDNSMFALDFAVSDGELVSTGEARMCAHARTDEHIASLRERECAILARARQHWLNCASRFPHAHHCLQFNCRHKSEHGSTCNLV